MTMSLTWETGFVSVGKVGGLYGLTDHKDPSGRGCVLYKMNEWVDISMGAVETNTHCHGRAKSVKFTRVGRMLP